MVERERVLTLGTIRDYILTYFPETLWWDGFNKHEVWNKERNYKHRQGLPNEIRIEFDNDDLDKNWKSINDTAINLNNKGISFAIFYVEGGRSPHIHIYDLDELEQLDYEQRTKYRELFLKQTCPEESNPDLALCDEKHLCALEFANHFKYNKPKQLLSYFWNGKNMGIDFDLKYKILFPKNKKKIIDKKVIKFGTQLTLRASKRLIGILNFQKILDKYEIKYRGTMAQCPFHADTNFSLSFSNEKGVWQCFGCHVKGDMITLIKMLKELKDGDKN